MYLLQLPWQTPKPPPDAPTLLFASRFDAGGSLRKAWQLLRRSGRVRAAALHADGCYGAALLARPTKGAYYTLSRWHDEAALAAFARHTTHRDAVRTMHQVGDVDGVLISWWQQPQTVRPTWRDVITRTAVSPTGPYRGPTNARESVGHRA